MLAASSRKAREMWRYCAVLLVVCLRHAGTTDLYWRPNSDWATPKNWALGHMPCEGETADLSSSPRGSVIYLGASTTVRSLVLPVVGRIELGKSISLRFSNKTTCNITSSSGPMVAEVKEEQNKFIGAGPKYWECGHNWETKEGLQAKTAPCVRDRAFFRKGHSYSTVRSNTSVTVQFLSIRGQQVDQGQGSIRRFTPEFDLNLTVIPECTLTPYRCPCLTNCKSSDAGKSTGGGSGGSSGRTAAIVVVVLVVVALVVLGAVLAVLCYIRHRRSSTTPYIKDDLLEGQDDTVDGTKVGGAAYENPVYESDTIKGANQKGKEGQQVLTSEETKAREAAAIAMLNPFARQYEPVNPAQPDTAKIDDSSTKQQGHKIPALNEYERL